MQYIKAWLGFAITFLVVDSVWINNVVLDLYARDVPNLLADEPNLVAAVLFYLAYITGCVWFAVVPKLATSSLASLRSGAALGALCYATFTLTSYAVLDGWTTAIAVSDILWGAFITAISAFVGHWCATRS